MDFGAPELPEQRDPRSSEAIGGVPKQTTLIKTEADKRRERLEGELDASKTRQAELEAELEAARVERDAANRLIGELRGKHGDSVVGEMLLPTHLVDAWNPSNRPDVALTVEDKRYAELLKRVKEAGGNMVPILVRPKGDRYEMAYGARRRQACEDAGFDVRAIIAPLTDEEMLVRQVEENEARAADSTWEIAMRMAGLEKVGRDRGELGRAFKLSAGSVSELLTVANAPAWLKDAFRPIQLLQIERRRWRDLMRTLKEDEKTLKKRAASVPAELKGNASAIVGFLLKSDNRKGGQQGPSAKVTKALSGYRLTIEGVQIDMDKSVLEAKLNAFMQSLIEGESQG
jgi:ParB/RepB/Spo0J family partition protein